MKIDTSNQSYYIYNESLPFFYGAITTLALLIFYKISKNSYEIISIKSKKYSFNKTDQYEKVIKEFKEKYGN